MNRHVKERHALNVPPERGYTFRGTKVATTLYGSSSTSSSRRPCLTTRPDESPLTRCWRTGRSCTSFGDLRVPLAGIGRRVGRGCGTSGGENRAVDGWERRAGCLGLGTVFVPHPS